MPDTAEIEREIAVITGLHALLTTNEELAVARMQQIRRSVLKTRNFMDEIIDVFREVRVSQARQVDEFYEERQRGWLLRQASRFTREDRSQPVNERVLQRPAAVLLSANDRLSGAIVPQVFDEFITHVRSTKSHPIIMGRVGRTMYEESNASEKADYYELPDDRDITLADIRPLVDTLSEYGDIRVFYGRFLNLMKQVPNTSQLGDSPLQTVRQKKAKAVVGNGNASGQVASYVFEPSLERVVEIFDSQILTALLTQIATEAQLGLLGSRVTTLERSQQLVEVYLDNLEKEKMRTGRAESNQKQRERLAGVALWNIGG